MRFSIILAPPLRQELSKPVAHTMVNLAKEMLVGEFMETAVVVLLDGKLQQTHPGGVHGTIDHIDYAANTRRYPAACREPEHLFGELNHAGQQRRTAGEHDSRGDALGIPALLDLLQDHLQHFLDARLDDVTEVHTRVPLRFAFAQAAYLHCLVHARHWAVGTPIRLLEALSLW